MPAAIAPAPASAAPAGGGGSPAPAIPGANAGQVPGRPGSPPPAAKAEGTGQENTVPGAKAGETEQQTVRRLERVEKINGKEVKLSATEDELWASKRRETAVQENARKIAAERKQLQEERQKWQEEQQRIQEDPFHYLRKDPAFNELEFFQERTHRLLTEQNKDPRDLALGEKDREIRRLRGEAEQRVEQQRQKEERAAEDAELRQHGALFAQAMKKAALPADDLALDLVAKAFYTAQEEEGLDLSVDELAVESRRMLTGALDNCAEKMDDEQLLEQFPKFAAKLHRALVAKYKRMAEGGQQKTSETPKAIRPSEPNGAAPRQMTEREQFKELEAKQGRRILRGV